MAVISCSIGSTLIRGPNLLYNALHIMENVEIDVSLWRAMTEWVECDARRHKLPFLAALLTDRLPTYREMPLLGGLHADLLAVVAGFHDASAREGFDCLAGVVARAVARAERLDQPGRRIIGVSFNRREPSSRDDDFPPLVLPAGPVSYPS